MTATDDTATRRARDVWAALVLMGVSVFFLWQTADIPLFGDNRAGVRGTDWFTSAALVPLGVFGAMLLLSGGLLVTALRAVGWRRALRLDGLGITRDAARRFTTLVAVLAAYIVGLVPRVDFILASALLISALVYGYYGDHPRRAWVAAGAVAAPAAFALVAFPAQRDWGAHTDDTVTLGVWLGLTALVVHAARREPVLRVVPVLSIVAPTLLVCAMAFGFRQNVPARTGLVFKQIEYHYFVTLKPLFAR
ncbi:MAG: hypothetical protein AAGA11_14285 [Pseudomonadota bacterium]